MTWLRRVAGRSSLVASRGKFGGVDFLKHRDEEILDADCAENLADLRRFFQLSLLRRKCLWKIDFHGIFSLHTAAKRNAAVRHFDKAQRRLAEKKIEKWIFKFRFSTANYSPPKTENTKIFFPDLPCFSAVISLFFACIFFSPDPSRIPSSLPPLQSCQFGRLLPVLFYWDKASLTDSILFSTKPTAEKS